MDFTKFLNIVERLISIFVTENIMTVKLNQQRKNMLNML